MEGPVGAGEHVGGAEEEFWDTECWSGRRTLSSGYSVKKSHRAEGGGGGFLRIMGGVRFQEKKKVEVELKTVVTSLCWP